MSTTLNSMPARFQAWVESSIGQKQIVAVTALAVSGFALMHMSANLLLVVSARAYNEYSHHLITNPLLPVAELGLLVAFIVHIFFALSLAKKNRIARGTGPSQLPAKGPKRASFASRTMVLSGLLLLTFVITHIWTFKFGTYYSVTYDGVEMRDLHRLVSEWFQNPLIVAWYIFALCVLGMHLSHGISSTLQSLGIARANTPWLRAVSWGFALIVAGGFIIQPLCLMACGSHGGGN